MTTEELQILKQMSWKDFMSQYWPRRSKGELSPAQFMKLIEIKQDNSRTADTPFNEQITESDAIKETLDLLK